MGRMFYYGEAIEGILKVTLNRADRPVNSFSRSAMDELDELIAHIQTDASIAGVIFQSAKPGNFIAGADVTELKDIEEARAARELSRNGQGVFQKLEELRKPAVAVISGACLGGGLEFAMACRYRICDDDSKTQFGLPEVKLGIVPAWGGTVRLPRTIGLTAALPMLLTGKTLSGPRARSQGLVHDCVPHEALDSVAHQVLATHLKSGCALSRFPQSKRSRWQQFLDRNGIYRSIALSKARKRIERETRGHYPAPLMLLDVVRVGKGGLAADEGYRAEAETVSKLATNSVTTELMRLFFLSEDAKKPPEDLTVEVDKDAIPSAAVLGAGAMGAGIALLLAKTGIWTRLKDINPEFLSSGMKTIRSLLKKEVQRKRITPLQQTQAYDHLSLTTDYRGLKNADIVIEAIIEDLNVKRSLFQELAEATRPETVLATNTSSLLVSDIAKSVPHPERVVGLHFFNPPHRMPLVEVIRTEQTSDAALAKALAVVSRLGKTKVVVGDCAGFLVNRLLSPYMNEAGYLLEEVADPLEIERAAIDFGMPMGPLELTDLVGLNVAAHVAENMYEAYGERMLPAPMWNSLREQLEASQSQGKQNGSVQLIHKHKGRKSLGKRVQPVLQQLRAGKRLRTIGREELIARLIYPLINEAARCLQEQIAASPDDIDLAMVFGTGFAPFRGGPMRYADAVGLVTVVEKLNHFAEQHPRYHPCELLRIMSGTGKSFAEWKTVQETVLV